MKSKGMIFIGFVVSQIISFLVFLIYFPASLVVTGIQFLCAIAARKSLKTAAFVLLLSPIPIVSTISFITGIVGYLNGEGCLVGVGLPGIEYSNLDPHYRCYWVSSGCCVTGSEVFTHEPHNFALKTMISLFGPMLGHYLGPYPDREQVFALLKKAPTVSLSEAKNAISKTSGSYVLASIDALFEETQYAPVRLAEYEGQIIIIGNKKYAHLFCTADGKRFAKYEKMNPWEDDIEYLRQQ